MKKAFVIKKGKRYVNSENCGYTSVIERARIWHSKTEAQREVLEDNEHTVSVTVTILEEQ